MDIPDTNVTKRNLTETFANVTRALVSQVPEKDRNRTYWELKLNQTAQGQLQFSSGAGVLSDEEVEIIREAVADQYCGTAAECNSTAQAGAIQRRVLLDIAFSRELGGCGALNVDYSLERIFIDNGASIDEITINVTQLQEQIVSLAAAANVTLNATADCASTPTEIVAIVAQTFPLTSALGPYDDDNETAIDAGALQEALRNASSVEEALQNVANLGVQNLRQDVCANRPCSGNGECVVIQQNNTGVCECDALFEGVQCEFDVPTPSPTATPSATPTSICSLEPRIILALDRTYGKKNRRELDFGVDVLARAMDFMQEEGGFPCAQVVGISLTQRSYGWMFDGTNPASQNGTALAISARRTDIGSDWRAGFQYRSLTLDTILEEDGPVRTFCATGDAPCHLVVLTDGKFRTRKQRRAVLREHRGSKSALGSGNLLTSCIFPRRRDARGYFGRKICDRKHWKRGTGNNAQNVAEALVDRILTLN